MLFWLTAVALVIAISLGGGTHDGFLGDFFAQLLAVALLTFCGWKLLAAKTIRLRAFAVPLSLVILFVLILVLQLTPLPQDLWSRIGANLISPSGQIVPGIEGVSTVNASTAEGWHALSLSPHATWASAVSLLVPLAIFCAVAQLDARSRLRLCWLILGLGGIALVLGLLQIAQGPQSNLRFFAFTNTSDAVGFFANRNHFAAQLYVTLVFAAVWFASMARASSRPGAFATHMAFWFATTIALLIAIIAGLAMARSRAGVILAVVAIFGIVAMIFASQRATPEDRANKNLGDRKFGLGRVALVTLGFAVVFAAQFGLHRIQSRFGSDPLEDLRIPLSATTLETAISAMPFGTGLGSFVPVYATVEKTDDIFSGFANRAHNDFAEFLLEAGIPSGLLMLIFLSWFALRVYAIWFSKPDDPRAVSRDQLMLSRAGTLVVMLLLAHSLVDYPLRTTALAALFAFSCAVLIPPAQTTSDGNNPKRNEADTSDGTPSPADNHKTQPLKPQRWGADITWPDAWQSDQR